MSQFDLGNMESPLSGTDLINGKIEPWRDALHTSHSGAARPSYVVPGMVWLKTGTNPWLYYMFDGTDDILIGSFDTTTNSFTAPDSGTLKVSSDDTTPSFISNKVANSREITLSILNDGADEDLQIGTRENAASPIAIGTGTATAAIANAPWQKITATGNIAIAATFDAGKFQSMILECVNFGAYTITWPAGIKWPGGTAPTMSASGTDHVLIYQDTANVKYGILVAKGLA